MTRPSRVIFVSSPRRHFVGLERPTKLTSLTYAVCLTCRLCSLLRFLRPEDPKRLAYQQRQCFQHICRELLSPKRLMPTHPEAPQRVMCYYRLELSSIHSGCPCGTPKRPHCLMRRPDADLTICRNPPARPRLYGCPHPLGGIFTTFARSRVTCVTTGPVSASPISHGNMPLLMR